MVRYTSASPGGGRSGARTSANATRAAMATPTITSSPGRHHVGLTGMAATLPLDCAVPGPVYDHAVTAPVVLLHGFATSSARTWGDNGWLDLLGDVGREPLAIDLLGHGTADKPHDPEAYAAMEQLVLDQLPDEPVDGIGFSLGARVLLTLACDHPERFGRLVLTGVGANLFRTEGSDLILRAIEGDGDPTNPVVQYFAGLAQHPEVDREALAACMRSPRPLLTPERLSTVAAPRPRGHR